MEGDHKVESSVEGCEGEPGDVAEGCYDTILVISYVWLIKRAGSAWSWLLCGSCIHIWC